MTRFEANLYATAIADQFNNRPDIASQVKRAALSFLDPAATSCSTCGKFLNPDFDSFTTCAACGESQCASCPACECQALGDTAMCVSCGKVNRTDMMADCCTCGRYFCQSCDGCNHA